MKSIKEKAKAYDEAIKRLEDIKTGKCQKTFVFTEGLFDYIFPELKESEDERMIQYFKDLAPFDKADELYEKYGFSHKDAIVWLEKQGEHAKFRDSIQIGDKVTRNQDCVLVNLSQLNRVAKKQGEQKSNPCDGCINRNGCINCENGELRETEQKPAWSEEDESLCTEIQGILGVCRIKELLSSNLYEKMCNWLKSIRHQSQWKPSDEQMEALDDFIYAKYPNVETHGAAVKSLYQDLKKLKE